VFPVFGRGRVLAGLAGKEITAEALQDMAGVLCGPCSCLAKRLNPGTDLLLAADWETLLTERPKEPEPSPPAGELVPIPRATSRPAPPSGQTADREQATATAGRFGLSPNLLLAAVGTAGLLIVLTGAWALKLQGRKTPGDPVHPPGHENPGGSVKDGEGNGPQAE
jgi:hypothetical protein